jgi:Tfp pilus assembly protein PilE
MPRPASQPSRFESRQAGLTLIDTLIYLAVLVVIATLAMSAFYQAWETHKDIVRVSDDIVRALQAGERWRNAVRAARTSPVPETTRVEATMTLPTDQGAAAFAFRDEAVWHRAPGATHWTLLLDRVRASRFLFETREAVPVWKWELELKARRANPRVPPLFTFQAVLDTTR